MSPGRARRLLWWVLLVAAPVPILVVGPGWVPVARLAFFGGITLSVVVVESARGAVPLLTAFLLVQAVVYAAALWLVAAVTTRVLRPLGARTAGRLTLALAAGLVIVTTVAAVYRDPYRPAGFATNLVQLYW